MKGLGLSVSILILSLCGCTGPSVQKRYRWENPVATSDPTPQALLSDECAAYVGTTIAPRSFDSVVAGLPKYKPKGEFETTANYQARMAGVSASGPIIIANTAITIEVRKAGLSYDADTQKLRIGRDIFTGRPFTPSTAFLYLSLKGQPTPKTGSDNISVVISESRSTIGSYLGSNSFGVKASVRQVSHVVKAIFDHGQDDVTDDVARLVADTGYNDHLGDLSLTPQEARLAIPNLKVAFIVVPKPPFVVRGQFPEDTPTLDSPISIAQTFTALIADIRCGLLTDAANKVLAAYAEPVPALPHT